MATGTLTGQTIANTYKSLLKITGTTAGGETLHATTQKVIEDGDGNPFPLSAAADALMITSTNRLEFGDNASYIHQSADGVLDLVSDTEIELNATTIDINGAVDMSSTLTVSGDVTISSSTSGKPELTIKNTNDDAEPSYLKFVKDTSTSAADNDEIAKIEFYHDDDGNNQTRYGAMIVSATDTATSSEDSKIRFLTRANATDTETLTLESGNVGIGTNSPSKILDIVTPSDAVAINLRTRASDDTFSFITWKDNNLSDSEFFAQIAGKRTGTDAGELQFYTSGDNLRLVIDNSGTSTFTSGTDYSQIRLVDTNTNQTTQRVSLNGQHYLSAEEDVRIIGLFSSGSGSTANNNTVGIGGGSGSHNSATSIQFYTASDATTVAGSTRMVIDSDGKVGIGTTNPRSKFHVEDATNRGVRFFSKSTTGISEGSQTTSIGTFSTKYDGTGNGHACMVDAVVTARVSQTSSHASVRTVALRLLIARSGNEGGGDNTSSNATIIETSSSVLAETGSAGTMNSISFKFQYDNGSSIVDGVPTDSSSTHNILLSAVTNIDTGSSCAIDFIGLIYGHETIEFS